MKFKEGSVTATADRSVPGNGWTAHTRKKKVPIIFDELWYTIKQCQGGSNWDELVERLKDTNKMSSSKANRSLIVSDDLIEISQNKGLAIIWIIKE